MINALDGEVRGSYAAAKWNISRALFGDGSGKLAKVIGAEKNGAYTILTLDGTKNVIEGLCIDVYEGGDDPTLTEQNSAHRIVSVDRAANTVTVLGTVTLTGEGFITVQGSFNRELCGLGAIFGDSETLYGLKRSEHKWLKPHKFEAEYISDTVIQKAIDAMEEVSGSTADFIVCSAGVKRAYQSYLSSCRTNSNVMDLDGGYKAITYNGIPIVSDRFCPEGTMYVLNTKDFHLHQLCDWRWLEGDDGKVLKQINGKPVYSATLVKYVDLICDRPIGQAVITGITEE
jgi:hypothetical protein